MEKMKLEFYKHVETTDEINSIKDVFDSNGIQYEVNSSGSIVDEAIIGTALFSKYTIRILPKDFIQANELLEKHFTENFDESADFSHFDEFSTDELLDILSKPDEWSLDGVIAAKKILQSRSTGISENEIKELKETRNQELRSGVEASVYGQIGFFIALIIGFFMAKLFVVIGLGMGYYYAYGKSTDRNGTKFYIYKEKSRRNGKIILVVGIIFLIIGFYLLST